MANGLFDFGRQKFLEGAIGWNSSTIKRVLLRSYSVNLATHQFLSDVTGGGGGTIVSTSAALGSKTSNSPVGGVADAADSVFTAVAAGAACTSIVTYVDTGVAGTSTLIHYTDTATGLPVTPTGGDIQDQFDNGTNRIFKL